VFPIRTILSTTEGGHNQSHWISIVHELKSPCCVFRLTISVVFSTYISVPFMTHRFPFHCQNSLLTPEQKWRRSHYTYRNPFHDELFFISRQNSLNPKLNSSIFPIDCSHFVKIRPQRLHLHQPTTTISTLNMAKSQPTVVHPRCEFRDCPLNEVGIFHSEGIYIHESKGRVPFDYVFCYSNPPPFMWETASSWKRVASFPYTDVPNMVLRYLNYGHAGCKCKFDEHRKQHFRHK
jgi:hypothetical protein